MVVRTMDELQEVRDLANLPFFLVKLGHVNSWWAPTVDLGDFDWDAQHGGAATIHDLETIGMAKFLEEADLNDTKEEFEKGMALLNEGRVVLNEERRMFKSEENKMKVVLGNLLQQNQFLTKCVEETSRDREWLITRVQKAAHTYGFSSGVCTRYHDATAGRPMETVPQYVADAKDKLGIMPLNIEEDVALGGQLSNSQTSLINPSSSVLPPHPTSGAGPSVGTPAIAVKDSSTTIVKDSPASVVKESAEDALEDAGKWSIYVIMNLAVWAFMFVWMLFQT
ncbi:hypothetical protein E3N88_29676 [Mikania micrantha]|uniref:Uncharacterized protein n=1 Tax=Mikania micrantha TaxID=192012 RepID=A0A5N6MJY7_9ASTR|nr:hypothetical protein E3N88_29676 [Mikania micrantha]